MNTSDSSLDIAWPDMDEGQDMNIRLQTAVLEVSSADVGPHSQSEAASIEIWRDVSSLRSLTESGAENSDLPFRIVTSEGERCETPETIDLTTAHNGDRMEPVLCTLRPHLAPLEETKRQPQRDGLKEPFVFVPDGALTYCVPKQYFHLWAKYHPQVQWDFENWPIGFEPDLQPIGNGHFFFDLEGWHITRQLAMVVMGTDEEQAACGCSCFGEFPPRRMRGAGYDGWPKVPGHLLNDRWKLSDVLNRVKRFVARRKGNGESERKWWKGVGQRMSGLACCFSRTHVKGR